MEPKTAGGGQQTKAGQQRETPLAILSLWFFSVPACPRTAAVAGSDLLQTARCSMGFLVFDLENATQFIGEEI